MNSMARGIIGAAALCFVSAAPSLAANCNLGNGINHIFHLTFDNVHLRRDMPNVPSDLEQIPSLLTFLKDNGVILANHHTPLISHTADDIITAVTGVYGSRHGQPVANSYGVFDPQDPTNNTVLFASSFIYWTGKAPDGTPAMINEKGLTAPAPWVPFTRAGCDVGAFSTANMEFEDTAGDVANVFGGTPGSPNFPLEATQDSQFFHLPGKDRNGHFINDPGLAVPDADFLGIAVHCAKDSALCSGSNGGVPDLLPDEPGGYTGFNALFGNIFVAPAINPGHTLAVAITEKDVNDNKTLVQIERPFVNDVFGNPITDLFGNPGLPTGFDSAPEQSLGYVEQMFKAGIPVVYLYIEDAHDQHGIPFFDHAFGPGEAGYVTQLQDFEKAFKKFFADLEDMGITKENTLFVVTSDENDHFAGSRHPQHPCDGINVPCTYDHVGEIDTQLDRILATQTGNTTPFDIHFDDAPNVYIHGNPGRTDPVALQFARDLAKLKTTSVITGNTDMLMKRMADPVEEDFLHMVTKDPRRTPNLTMFGSDDYYFEAFGDTAHCDQPDPFGGCFFENSGFAWNHGDFQREITHNWAALVGPGVKPDEDGINVFTDHTDLRPTLLSLVGLEDDYEHDGRAIFESMTHKAIPPEIREHLETAERMARLLKAINAPVGSLGVYTLKRSTTALVTNDNAIEDELLEITKRRNDIASQMVSMLEASTFNGKEFNEAKAQRLIKAAERLLDETLETKEATE
jgi:arylsulfatase A-like enzyme